MGMKMKHTLSILLIILTTLFWMGLAVAGYDILIDHTCTNLDKIPASAIARERGCNNFHKKAHRFGPDLFDLKSQKLK